MRLIAVITAAVAIGSVQGAPPSSGLSGRWRLADSTQASATIAEELLITQTEASAWLSIERRFASGVRMTLYPIVGAKSAAPGARPATGAARPGRPAPVEAVWTGAAFLIRTGSTGIAPRATDHEELWAIEGDRLHMDSTDRMFGGPARTSRVTYHRVPLPDFVKPGENLVENGDGVRGPAQWLPFRDAAVEPCDASPCFRIRDPGTFQQTVVLPANAADQYLALVGSGASERVNADGVITGLPALYGLIGSADGVRILGYLTGQQLLARPPAPNVWVKMSGVFRVPKGAAHVSVQLKQASARGTPPDGSAARFDDIGLYLFPSEADAQSFVANWQGRTGSRPEGK